MCEHNGSMVKKVGKCVGIAILGSIAIAVLGAVVMALWNGLMPSIFGFKTLHFWQAVGLLALSRILFGGFHRCHGHHFRHRRHMLERWERMTPEEREKFKRGFHSRFCRCSEPEQG